MGHVDYMAAVAGLPENHVFDLENPRTHDARRRAVFPFARKLTDAPETIERKDVEALRAHFTDAEIVQVVFAVCHFNTMNRLAHAFGVPLERSNVFAQPDGAKETPTVVAPDASTKSPRRWGTWPPGGVK
jgi:uncharacterized protein YciW